MVLKRLAFFYFPPEMLGPHLIYSLRFANTRELSNAAYALLLPA